MRNSTNLLYMKSLKKTEITSNFTKVVEAHAKEILKHRLVGR